MNFIKIFTPSNHIKVSAGYYSNRNYFKGQKFEIDGITGIIVDINNVNISIKDGSGEQTIVPLHKFVTNNVKILP